MGLPKGSYWVPSGTVAYKVITLTGSIVVRERSATINILASAGVTISDQRAYTFSWNSDTASGAGKRMGTLALDDNLFGSMKRTSVEPVLYDEEKQTQVRITINTFRGVEYLHVRKYYMDFEEEWKPTPEGIAMPVDFNNAREMFRALVEILSLAESKEIIEENFQDLIQDMYKHER